MTEQTGGGSARDEASRAPVRREWTAPSLRHFAAGRAETGTGTGPDSSFPS